MFCDNESIYTNVSTPELTLEKNNVSICYHKCREDVDSRVAHIAREGTAINLADMFTNILGKIILETLLDKLT